MNDMPVKKVCADCSLNFTTMDPKRTVCKFCRQTGDDLSVRLKPSATGRTDLWTVDMVAMLREAVAKKMTAGQIADALSKRFGLRLTRNSVIGKCHRLGIRVSDKSKPAMRKLIRARPSAPKPLRQSVQDRGGAGFVTTIGNRNALPLLPASSPPQTPLPMQPDPAPVLRADGQPHDMLSLPYGGCKWPISGHGKHMRFCGDVAGIDDPYCEFHARKSVTHAEKSEVAK